MIDRILTFILLMALWSFMVIGLAHAESIHFTWLKADDAKFRAAYLAKNGEESIQANPLESEDGLTYQAASSRVTQKQLDELKADRNISKEGDIKTRLGSSPDGFILKISPE